MIHTDGHDYSSTSCYQNDRYSFHHFGISLLEIEGVYIKQNKNSDLTIVAGFNFVYEYNSRAASLCRQFFKYTLQHNEEYKK